MRNYRFERGDYSRLVALFSSIIVLTLFLASCASPVGKYTPATKMATKAYVTNEDDDEYTDKKPEAPKLNIANPVNIINSNPRSKDQPLHFRGIIVNYHAFSQSVVDALKLEYLKHKVTISDSAQKKLNIKIIDITMSSGSFNFRADIVARVTLGNGDEEEFKTSRASYASPMMVQNFPTDPLDAAYADLVKNIISNPSIQQYLKN